MPENADDVKVDDPPLALDFAWRVHYAVQQWTHNVDQKANIVLVFTTGLSAVAAREVLSHDGGLHGTHGFQLWVVRGMGVLFAASVLFALSAVFPYLRPGQVAREAGRGLIYFGHLHYRNAHEIRDQLAGLDASAALDHLSHELSVTGSIAWRKHLRVRASLLLLLLAGASFAFARLVL